VEEEQSFSCWLYAMLIWQSVPRPVDDETLEQVGKTMSMVPSRSAMVQKEEYGRKLNTIPTSAKDIDCTPEGREPSWDSENPSSLLFTHI
jgi:hypothetical protein